MWRQCRLRFLAALFVSVIIVVQLNITAKRMFFNNWRFQKNLQIIVQSLLITYFTILKFFPEIFYYYSAN